VPNVTPLRYAVLAAVLTGMSGCTHGNVLVLDPLVRPETQPDAVQLLAKEPEQPYVVIGLVSAWSELGGVGAARKRLQHEAARLGGHALLFDSESLGTAAKGHPQLSAKVIVFQGSPATKPPQKQERL
jgi:hypothetical protein